jgi:hypothetical protein
MDAAHADFRVHKVSRSSIVGKGKLAAVVESMNLLVVVVERLEDPWLHFARLLLHPLQVIQWRPKGERLEKLLQPFSEVLAARQVTVAAAGSRALLTATLRAVWGTEEEEGAAVVELESRSASEFEEGLSKAREELMNVARTKNLGVNLGRLEIWRLRISSVDASGVLIAADELYMSGWLDLEIGVWNFRVQLNCGEAGEVEIIDTKMGKKKETGNFLMELDGPDVMREISKFDIDGHEYDVIRQVGISDAPESPDETRSRLFQHRLRLAMGTGGGNGSGVLVGWKIVLAFDFDRKCEGVRLKTNSSTKGNSRGEFLQKTILAPIMEGPNSSRSSVM